MTANTGRTVGRYVDVQIKDSGGTLRSIPVDTINGLGLKYDETELTAFQDAIKGVLNGHPDFNCTIGGPFDTRTAASAGTLSGSHTVLAALVGGNTPLSFAVYLGMRQAWQSGEPVFGIASSSVNGVLVTSYDVDVMGGKYTATLRMYTGSAAPAWGTSSIS